ncbi:hypothetical protein GQ55_8G017100 [Panicum hallii var. hallii]|uniref:Uncharacterized protein n=1 Tax=Panicum hallii var. hallii TaxID=1504633 RepID=A0A2T7CJK1_9POAL|nr:hypothetical protein GQ55_8G017100 [Panicum hallii var. hallii]
MDDIKKMLSCFLINQKNRSRRRNHLSCFTDARVGLGQAAVRVPAGRVSIDRSRETGQVHNKQLRPESQYTCHLSSCFACSIVIRGGCHEVRALIYFLDDDIFIFTKDKYIMEHIQMQ